MFHQDHVAMFVKDLAASREFYEYLGGRMVSKPSPNFLEIMLGEVRLHILPLPKNAGAKESSNEPRIGIDHLCLRVASFEELVYMQAKINAFPSLQRHEPYVIEESPPLSSDRRTHCEERPPRMTLYFEDPDGIKLEIRAYAEK